MTLIDHLKALADVWHKTTGRSLSRLATVVAKDGKFFTRLDLPGRDTQTAMFERFLAFFRSGDNWPDNRIPQAAVDLLDRLDAIATEGRASPDNAAENIGVAA